MSRDLLIVLFGDPFAVMNTVGLVAFALVGSTKAIREDFDLFGITIVGLAMAFAGGATRDLLVMRTPLALQSPIEIALGLFGVALAIGLAAFATTGAIVATEAGVSAFGVVAIATINAVGGGAFADLLLDRAPFILFEDFYANCAVLGGLTYVVAGAVGVVGSTAAALCAAVTVVTRLAAVTYGWELPTAGELEPPTR
ncbi:TRIC cation channel family protein [Halorubrum sp. F4]|uniref:trimeric intracellular cation channel family protein n=1 Tax=Halorubrum sp. F4 TaxID=2989715 RepID=UPI0024814B7B|nr:TRIC cation channel family protein [Halorubrum sp. F4]